LDRNEEINGGHKGRDSFKKGKKNIKKKNTISGDQNAIEFIMEAVPRTKNKS